MKKSFQTEFLLNYVEVIQKQNVIKKNIGILHIFSFFLLLFGKTWLGIAGNDLKWLKWQTVPGNVCQRLKEAIMAANNLERNKMP